MKLIYRIIALVLALASMTFLAACGKKNAEKPEESALPTVETVKPEAYGLIGEESDGENVFSVKLTNRTGAEIVAVSVKDDSMEQYPENMLPADEVFSAGETRILWYDANSAIETAKAAAESHPDDPELTPAYSMQVTFADGTIQELSMIPFGDAEKCDLFYNGDILYLTYKSTSTKETVNTLELEKASREPAVEETPVPTAQPKQTQWQPTTQQPVQPQQQTPQPTVAPEPDPEPVDDTLPDGGCIEDGLMW